MNKEKVVFMPDHPNANIHGMITEDGDATCLTRNPEIRCTGCCYALHITSNGKEDGKILKEAGEMCDAQIPKAGCAHIKNGTLEKRFEPVCSGFHCSKQLQKFADTKNVHAKQRIGMCNIASMAVGEIDQKTYDENLKRIGI
ncbi:MAG TPA: hypothetical protein VG895_00970 [Patescibacteria group bacterium]|nr:hypothetical protein [Patescibacteria group bacterium]